MIFARKTVQKHSFAKKQIFVQKSLQELLFSQQIRLLCKSHFKKKTKKEIVQKSQHKLISNKELCTKIIDGPAKNTIINIICIENGQGSEIKFDINLKLSLKAKFLSPLIKKLYKRYLTAIIYKIISRETNKIY